MNGWLFKVWYTDKIQQFELKDSIPGKREEKNLHLVIKWI